MQPLVCYNYQQGSGTLHSTRSSAHIITISRRGHSGSKLGQQRRDEQAEQIISPEHDGDVDTGPTVSGVSYLTCAMTAAYLPSMNKILIFSVSVLLKIYIVFIYTLNTYNYVLHYHK